MELFNDYGNFTYKILQKYLQQQQNPKNDQNLGTQFAKNKQAWKKYSCYKPWLPCTLQGFEIVVEFHEFPNVGLYWPSGPSKEHKNKPTIIFSLKIDINLALTRMLRKTIFFLLKKALKNTLWSVAEVPSHFDEIFALAL